MSKSEIAKRLKQLEGRNARLVEELSYLNPHGKTMGILLSNKKLEQGDNRRDIESIAQWVGKAMMEHPLLTSAQEDQLFDYLLYNGGAFTAGVLGKWLRRSALRVHAKALPRLPMRKRNGLNPCGLRVRAGFPAAAAAHPQFVQVFVNSFVSTADWQYPLKKANSALSPTFFSVSCLYRLCTPLFSHFLRSQEKMTCFATDVKLCSYRVDLCNRLTISRQD